MMQTNTAAPSVRDSPFTINEEEFDRFYEEQLAPNLESVKKACRKSDHSGFRIIAAAFASAFFALWFMGPEQALPAALFFCGLAALVYSVYSYTRNNDAFDEKFKEVVIRKIVEHVDPSFTYDAGRYITEKEYINSALNRTEYDSYDGDDLIKGTYKGVAFHCCNLEVSVNEGNVYKGLFFAARINPVFHGGTYIWPEDAEQLPASMMDEYLMIQLPTVARVHIPETEFNNYFSVCTTSQQQAAALLTPAMRNNIIHFRERLGGYIALSFVKGCCYVAIPSSIDLLETSDYEPGDKDDLKTYYATVLLILEIIDRLSLASLQ